MFGIDFSLAFAILLLIAGMVVFMHISANLHGSSSIMGMFGAMLTLGTTAYFDM